MSRAESSLKGDGKSGTRWVMRNSNGTEWVTSGRYTPEQVEQWECAKPIRPVHDDIVPLVI